MEPVPGLSDEDIAASSLLCVRIQRMQGFKPYPQ